MHFKEFLQSQEPKLLKERATREESKKRWEAALSSLMGTLARWLTEFDPHQLLRLERNEVSLSEHSTGVYSARGITIWLSDRCVRIVPVALDVLGPRISLADGGKWAGRVDIVGDSVKYEMFRRVAGDGEERWYLRDSDTYAIEVLDEDSFGAALSKAFS